MIDLVMNHDEAIMLVEEYGWDGFLNYFNDKYVNHNFYSCSTAWYDNSKYICKFKGSRGDLIIGWSGVHDN